MYRSLILRLLCVDVYIILKILFSKSFLFFLDLWRYPWPVL